MKFLTIFSRDRVKRKIYIKGFIRHFGHKWIINPLSCHFYAKVQNGHSKDYPYIPLSLHARLNRCRVFEDNRKFGIYTTGNRKVLIPAEFEFGGGRHNIYFMTTNRDVAEKYKPYWTSPQPQPLKSHLGANYCAPYHQDTLAWEICWEDFIKDRFPCEFRVVIEKGWSLPLCY